jgi:hypothetical protein
LLLGQKRLSRQIPFLLPALAALIVSSTGVAFQLWHGDDTSLLMYLLRIVIAFGSTWLFALVLQRRDTVADWGAAGVLALALAQVAPLPGLNLGFLAVGLLIPLAPFPALAMAGIALDLACVTMVPMTAVLSVAFVLRLLPRMPRWMVCAVPAISFLLVMYLCGMWELTPLPMLLLGNTIGLILPGKPAPAIHRGSTGVAQVRLEMAAGVLSQSEQLLSEVQDVPLDEQTLILKAAERACGTCPCRKSCRETEKAKQLPAQLLHRPLFTMEDLPLACKKRGRVMVELRRSQDQYRLLKADRERRREYHSALLQQYRFLTEYMQDLADELPRRAEKMQQRFRPEVEVRSAGKEGVNGDRCVHFAGPELKYYVLLCDGMGTGEGAALEAKEACAMLRRLLMAGFPAPYALRSLNSLCTLRGVPGAVSIDLAQTCLETGKTTLYKWGAAPSWLLAGTGAEKIGTAGAPPGLSITDSRETVDRLSLRRGETLVLLSDGVDGEEAMRHRALWQDRSPGEMAAGILDTGRGEGADDATVAVVRLLPWTTST